MIIDDTDDEVLMANYTWLRSRSNLGRFFGSSKYYIINPDDIDKYLCTPNNAIDVGDDMFFNIGFVV